jgi:hypothetical protein
MASLFFQEGGQGDGSVVARSSPIIAARGGRLVQVRKERRNQRFVNTASRQ